MDAPSLDTLPLDDILDRFRSGETWTRVYATMELQRRIVLVPGMMQDIVRGCTDAICSHCGQGFEARDIRAAMVHVGPTGICRNGFTAEHTCDCGKAFESVILANSHRIRLNCFHYRIGRERERKALFCEPCKHQCLDAKALATHLKTKAHHKATHPDEFVCEPCNHKSRCKTEHEAHLASKGHRQSVQPTVLRCEICAVDFRCTAEQDRHLAGKQHLYKATPTARPTLTCDLCGITRPSHAQYQAHLATAKHRKKAEAQACPEDPVSPDDAEDCLDR